MGSLVRYDYDIIIPVMFITDEGPDEAHHRANERADEMGGIARFVKAIPILDEPENLYQPDDPGPEYEPDYYERG